MYVYSDLLKTAGLIVLVYLLVLDYNIFVLIMISVCLCQLLVICHEVSPGLYAGSNYCQSHVLVDTWMLTIKLVYKLSNCA